ncbi:hypothetical protein ACOSQ2_022038 [Xanthoceras sorbifolium]
MVIVKDESDISSHMVPPTPTLPPIYSHDNSSKIEIKLDGSNYHLWSKFVEIFVAGKDKYGFLTGKSVKPATISPTYRLCLRGQSSDKENLSSENEIPGSLTKKTEPTLIIYERQNKGKEKQWDSVFIQVIQPSSSPSPVRQSDSEVENAPEVTLKPSILSDDLSSENHTNIDPSLSTRRYPSQEHKPPARDTRMLIGLGMLVIGDLLLVTSPFQVKKNNCINSFTCLKLKISIPHLKITLFF